MTATAAAFLITDEELEDASAPSFDAIEIDTDYEATLSAVEDYDKTEKGGTKGWIATFRIEGLPFKIWIPHSKAARWKLIEFVHSFRPGFFDVRNEDGSSRPVDPTEFVGEVVGAHIVLDTEMDTPMKVIQYIFSLNETEPTPDTVPVL